MKYYVLGFYGEADTNRIVLIRKNRPEWCAGKLNGLGGSIEEDETAVDAMVREFYEESGIQTTPANWRSFITVLHEESTMFVFVGSGSLEGVVTECDEGAIELYTTIPTKDIDSTALALLMLINDSHKCKYLVV